MLISKTYEIWTQDDLELGDTDKKGFIFQDENYSLHFNGTDRQKKYWIKALKIHLEIKD